MQPHLIMARCRQLLIERLPDVYAAMLAAGVAEAPLRTQMPDTLADTAPRPATRTSCDPEVVACTRDALSRHGSGPPVVQPTRAQLLAALTA